MALNAHNDLGDTCEENVL